LDHKDYKDLRERREREGRAEPLLRVLKGCRETLDRKDLLGIQEHRGLLETQDLKESRV
jgi:hypothetical protein